MVDVGDAESNRYDDGVGCQRIYREVHGVPRGLYGDQRDWRDALGGDGGVNMNDNVIGLDTPRLHSVTWPLVKLLNRDDLSWSDRAEIAEAINKALVHFDSMANEQRHLHGGAQEMQTASGSVRGGYALRQG